MITVIILLSIIIPVCCTRKKRRRCGSRRTVIKTVYTPGNKNVTCAAQRRQFEQERKNAEKARIEQFKRQQAENDIIHYTQVKADLLKAYNAARADGDTEKAIRKRIAYDNALRNVEKQLEKAVYIAGK